MSDERYEDYPSSPSAGSLSRGWPSGTAGGIQQPSDAIGNDPKPFVSKYLADYIRDHADDGGYGPDTGQSEVRSGEDISTELAERSGHGRMSPQRVASSIAMFFLMAACVSMATSAALYLPWQMSVVIVPSISGVGFAVLSAFLAEPHE